MGNGNAPSNGTPRPIVLLLTVALLLALGPAVLAGNAAASSATGFQLFQTDDPEGTPVEGAVEATETPAEPTPTVTQVNHNPEPTIAADSPTPEPTVEPTPIRAPELAWRLATRPECELPSDSVKTLASGGALIYRCISRVRLDGSAIVPASILIDWTVRASIGGDWRVSIQSSEREPWIESQRGLTVLTISGSEGSLNGNDAVDSFDRIIEFRYRVKIERADCDFVARPVSLTHAVTVTAVGATVSDSTANVEPLLIEPRLQEIPEPGVSFDGPLDFGTIGATASGPVQSTLSGELTATVTGLDRTCGDWLLNLTATPLVDGAGEVLEGAALVVTSVNGVPLAAGACDLTDGCAVMALAAGPGADTELRLTFSLELHFPADIALGAFGTTVDATLNMTTADTD